MKKKNDEKKKVQEGCWATAHFQFALGHDTTICIVTQGWGGWPGHVSRARMVGHDTTGWATIQPTTRPREAMTQPAARARGAWLGVSVAIQSIVS